MPLLPHHNIPKKKGSNTMNRTSYAFVEFTGQKYKIHHNLHIREVLDLLSTLKKNKYNHKHELHGNDGKSEIVIQGYGDIQKFCHLAMSLPKDDIVGEQELNSDITPHFIREVDVIELITKIQSLSSTPGNEKEVHELSTVLKYVMNVSNVKDNKVIKKRTYCIYYQTSISSHDIDIIASSEDEALEIFKKIGIHYHTILQIHLKLS